MCMLLKAQQGPVAASGTLQRLMTPLDIIDTDTFLAATSEGAYLMQVIAIAITVDSSVHLCSGMVLLYQVQQLCVALCPDGLHSAE